MKRLAAAIAMALVVSICMTDNDVQAQQSFFGGFQPFGFYQPYGARFGATLRQPPYFALNPPVYYGTRYARPYGVSPFASPPVVTAPPNYQSRTRPGFQQTPIANPYVTKSRTVKAAATLVQKGDVKFNPFATEERENRLVQN